VASPPPPAAPVVSRTSGSISTVQAAAIGVGGMMGAGLHILVGLATTTAGFAEHAADLLPGTYPSSVVKLIVVGMIVAVVGQMASLAFPIVHGMASVGHLRVRHQTGAHSGPLVAVVVLTVALFALLLGHSIRAAPASTWLVPLGALMMSFAFEAVYRRRRGAPRGASQTRW
jgi:hypothetical protein